MDLRIYQVILYIVISILSGVLLTMLSHKPVQMLQLGGYKVRGYFDWLKGTKFEYFWRYVALCLFAVATTVGFYMAFGEYGFASYFGWLLFAFFCILFFVVTIKQKNKTPLKITARVKRLFVALGIINIAVSFGLVFASVALNISYLMIVGSPLLILITLLLAHLVMVLPERLNNKRYYKMAKNKLIARGDGLIKIGITGSYGKTTIKNMLAAMLKTKYNVCFSPASFNTPMGLSKVINYELKDEHEVLIAEMGARRMGDIRELCELVGPNISMLSAIGWAHLDTFGSRDNIAKGKYEIIEGLVEGGLAVFNAEGGAIGPLIDKTVGRKTVSGNGDERQGLDCSYTGLKFGADGCEFLLSVNGESRLIRTELLGKYVPDLISMCAAVAYELGVSLEDIATVCGELESVPHRLQLIRNGNTAIIDDAYNSNPDGAEAALEVLGCFEGVKIVVTPGIVEMGKDEERVNTELGRQIAKVSDHAILVGSLGEYIAIGCSEGGMSDEVIYRVASLDEATAKLATISPNEIRAVLFENDLPDNIR